MLLLEPLLGLVSLLALSKAQIRQLGEERLAEMWHLVYSLGLVSPLAPSLGLGSPLALQLGLVSPLEQRLGLALGKRQLALLLECQSLVVEQ